MVEYDNPKQAGTNIGFYFLVFVGSVFVAGIIDACGIFNNLIYSYAKVANQVCLQEKIASHKERNDASGSAFQSVDDYNDNESTNTGLKEKPTASCSILRGSPSRYEFHPSFLAALVSERLYYNCTNASTMNSACRSDYIFYVLNQNSLLSMFACVPEHPFSRYDRRLAFIVQHSVAFIFAILFKVIGDSTTTLILNIFVVIPIKMVVVTGFYAFVACPCLQGTEHGCLKCLFGCCEKLGSFWAHIFVVISLLWLVLAGYGTVKNDNLKTLGGYLWSVFVIGQVVENILAFFNFALSTCHVDIKVCCITVFTISPWYQSYIKNKNIATKSRTLCCLYPFLSINVVSAERGIVPEMAEIEAGNVNQNTSQQSVIIPQYPTASPQVVSYAPQMPGNDQHFVQDASYDSLRNMIDSSNENH